MKKLCGILFVTISMVACQSPNQTSNIATADSVIENHDKHLEKTPGLTLNKGVKWKADSTTLLNVVLLQKIVSDPKRESLEKYLKIADDMQVGFTKMVSECKMKGDDHEALHHWLEPLMDKTKELKNANSIETARTIFGDIEKQINLFPQYFE